MCRTYLLYASYISSLIWITYSLDSTPSKFCNETLQCVFNTMLDNNGVFCDGFYSCTNSVITADAITCDGAFSCVESQLTAASILSCDGQSACYLGKAVSDDLLTCNGKYGCSYSNHLQAKTELNCGGFMSCMHANIINTAVIVANGERALTNANIDSANAIFYFNGQAGLVINAKGYWSGIGANVYCRKDTQCTLHCDGSGCYGLNIYCYYGSQCILEPTACAVSSSGPGTMLIVEGVQCPNVYVSISDQQDQTLDDLAKQREISRIAELDKFLSTDELYKYDKYYRDVNMRRKIRLIEDNKKLRYYNNFDGIIAVLLVIAAAIIVLCVYGIINVNKSSIHRSVSKL